MAKTNHKFPDHANRNYYERDTEFEVLLNSLYIRSGRFQSRGGNILSMLQLRPATSGRHSVRIAVQGMYSIISSRYNIM